MKRTKKSNKQTKNWVVTINYKNDAVKADIDLQNELLKLNDIKYFIFQLEKGKKKTYHHQLFIQFSKKKYFTQIKEMFPTAHIEDMKGTSEQARDYCSKNDRTRATQPTEWGEITVERQRADLVEIVEQIKKGLNILELIELYPTQVIRYKNQIESLITKYQEKQMNSTFRNIQVVYLYGDTGVGKTRTIMEHFGYENVYRVNDYKHPFDTYNGQKILILDEFHSQLKFEFMLNLLDGYPLKLPARYNDKIAQFEKVFIISNEPLQRQYPNIQNEIPKTYQALTRRIHYEFNLDQLKIHLSLPF